MQLLLDHLTSLLVAGVLILTLSTSQLGSKRAGIEQVASYSMKSKTLVFGTWVERDVIGLGAQFGRNLYRFGSPYDDLDADGNTREWVFYSDSVRTPGDTLRVVTRYTLLETITAAFRDTTYQLYQLRRDSVHVPLVNGTAAAPAAGDWRSYGESIGTLSFFQVHLLDRQGMVPTDPATGEVRIEDVDYVRVRFGVVPEYVLKPDNTLRELYWSRTMKVRPYWAPPA